MLRLKQKKGKHQIVKTALNSSINCELTFSSQPPNKGGRRERAGNIAISHSSSSRNYDINRAWWEGRGL